MFDRSITLRGGIAPVRACIPKLLPDGLSGALGPGPVFDGAVPLAEVPDGYRARDDRSALKVRITVRVRGPAAARVWFLPCRVAPSCCQAARFTWRTSHISRASRSAAAERTRSTASGVCNHCSQPRGRAAISERWRSRFVREWSVG